MAEFQNQLTWGNERSSSKKEENHNQILNDGEIWDMMERRMKKNEPDEYAKVKKDPESMQVCKGSMIYRKMWRNKRTSTETPGAETPR